MKLIKLRTYNWTGDMSPGDPVFINPGTVESVVIHPVGTQSPPCLTVKMMNGNISNVAGTLEEFEQACRDAGALT